MSCDCSASRRRFLFRSSAIGLAGLVGSFRRPESFGGAGTEKPERPDNEAQPELIVVSRLGADDTFIRSFISQLLERGIFFEHTSGQELLHELPKSLVGCRAVAFDGSAYEAAMSEPATAGRLAEFAGNSGLVFRLDDLPAGIKRDSFDASLLADLLTHHQSASLIAHAELTEFHPAFEARQLERPDEIIVAEMRRANLTQIRKMRSWGEFTNHYWWPAKLLADSGDAEVRETLMTAIRESCRNLPSGYIGDQLAGLWGAAWLFRQTGEREPLDKAARLLDRVIEQRPRTMGVLNFNGYLDDALGVQAAVVDGKRDTRYLRETKRVNWTEALHMQCGALAAVGRAIGDRRYLDAAFKLIEHCGKYHLDPQDNLLYHATRDGLPVTAKWGRGHSHALYGMMFTLEELPVDDARRATVLQLLDRVGDGLLKAQDARTGLWRNEVSLPVARLETSCTASFVYIYGRCAAEGWLPRTKYEPMVRRGWSGLKRMYWRTGLGAQCRGTSVGPPPYYLARPQGWSPVPQLLLAAIAMERLNRG